MWQKILRICNVLFFQGDTDEPESKKSRLEDQNQLDEGEDDELVRLQVHFIA